MSTFLKNLKLTHLKSTQGLLHLANDQAADTKDFGFVGEYNTGSGANKFSGLVRDATDGRFVLFENLATDPTTIDAIDSASAAKAPLDVLDIKVTSTKGVDDLSGAAALDVSGGAKIAEKLKVNSDDTLLALQVAGGATLEKQLKVKSADTLLALEVLGGATLEKQLKVKSDDTLLALEVLGGATLEKQLKVKSADELLALEVLGGATLEKKLKVKGTSEFQDDMQFSLNKTVTLGMDPVNDMHAATKQYVDNVAQGLDVKQSVRALSTSNQPLSEISSPLVIDGVTIASGDRVLLNGQTDATQNGIYVYNSATNTLVRSIDADGANEISAGAFTFVSEGSVYGDTGWVLSTNDAVTVGTSPLSFTQFSSAGILSVANLGTADNVNVAHLYKEKVGNEFRFYAVKVASDVASGTAASDDLLSISTNSDDIEINFDQSKISGLGDVTSGSISSGFGDITLDYGKTVTAGTFASEFAELTTDAGVNKLSFLTNASEIVIPANLADSLKITDGTHDYLTFQSGSSYQYVELSKDVHLKENFNESVIDISASSDLSVVKGCIFRVNAASGPVNVYLPAASVADSVGRNIKIIKVDSSANTVTVLPQDTGLVNGEVDGSFTLELQYEHVKVTSDGDGWYTM